MERISLECANCTSHDFDVEVSCLPTAVMISCNKCGRVTPLLIFAEGSHLDAEMLAINGKAAKELFDDAFCKTITLDMLRKAHECDIKEKKNHGENTD